MSRRSPYRLVIDASVARASGMTDHPVSSACREFLEAVRRICHQVVFTSDIKREWDVHQSKFARGWLASMVARRKRIYQEAQVDNDLVGLVEDVIPVSSKKKSAIRKDLPLIAAAMASDYVVVSLDSEANELIEQNVLPHRPNLRRIV